jgi:hypothetical protein
VLSKAVYWSVLFWRSSRGKGVSVEACVGPTVHGSRVTELRITGFAPGRCLDAEETRRVLGYAVWMDG